MNANYLPELREADATGRVAEIYGEIRQVSGVPYVSTLQRFLATMPGVLEYGWAAVRPAMVSGAAPEAAWRAAREAAPPPLPPMSPAVLRLLGVADGDLDVIRNVAANFARVSPVNVVTGAMLEPLAKGAPPPAGAGFGDERHGAPDMLTDMPPLPAMDSLDDDLRDALAALMVPIGGQPFLPALYRQFARWPAFAGYLAAVIPPRRQDPAVAEAEARAIGGIVAAGRTLYERLPPPPADLATPDAATSALIVEAIARYRETSADMICTGQALLLALPEHMEYEVRASSPFPTTGDFFA